MIYDDMPIVHSLLFDAVPDVTQTPDVSVPISLEVHAGLEVEMLSPTAQESSLPAKFVINLD